MMLEIAVVVMAAIVLSFHIWVYKKTIGFGRKAPLADKLWCFIILPFILAVLADVAGVPARTIGERR